MQKMTGPLTPLVANANASEDLLLAAARDAAGVRARIERGLAEVVESARRRAGGSSSAGKENVGGGARAFARGGFGGGQSRLGAPNRAALAAVTREREDEARWAAAVIHRLRQLVLEAEREVGRATTEARCAAAGEAAALRRAVGFPSPGPLP